MVFLEISNLKQAFKLPVIVFTLLTFSTSASPSGKFLFFRFLVFLTFSLNVLYRVSLLFHREVENNQQQQEVLRVESVALVIDWVFGIVVTVFMGYQVFKRKSLKVFELAAKIDRIFTSIYELKIDYTRTFITNFAAFSLILLFSLTLSVLNGFRNQEMAVMIFDTYTTFLEPLFFFIPIFIISICLEIRWRLKLLRKIMNRQVKVSDYKKTSHELDNLLIITQMLSEMILNLSDFFGVEIFIILGKICDFSGRT